MANVLLIANPIAGKKKALNILAQTVRVLSQKGYHVITHITGGKGDATKAVKENAEKVSRVVCLGGDGTLNEVFTGIIRAGKQIPVGYIPTGTTNDFAHTLNLPADISQSIEIAAGNTVHQHDIGFFNDQLYFSYVASFGAFTQSSYTTPQWLKNCVGRLAYIAEGIMSIGKIRSYRIKVTAGETVFEDDYIFGSVSNSSVVGGMIKFPNDQVILDDGLFEVLLIKKPRNAFELCGIMSEISNKNYNFKNVSFFKAKQITFEFKDHAQWTIDGEYAGNYRQVHIQNLTHIAQIIA